MARYSVAIMDEDIVDYVATNKEEDTLHDADTKGCLNNNREVDPESVSTISLQDIV